MTVAFPSIVPAPVGFRSLRAAAISVCSLVLAACGDGAVSSPSGPPSGPDLREPAEVVIAPPDSLSQEFLLGIGGSVQLQVQVLNAIGEVIVDPDVAWSSQHPLIAQVDQTGLVMGLQPGTATIRALAGGSTGEFPVTVEDLSEPDAPQQLTAFGVSHERIDLTWTVGSRNTEEFRLERREDGAGGSVPAATGASVPGTSSGLNDGGAFEEIAVLDAGTGSFADEGLAPGVAYHYRIRACNVNGCSPFEGPVEATTIPQLVIETLTLPEGTSGVPYEVQLSASGGDGNYVWGLAGGDLPEGMAIDSQGTISGVPATSGSHEILVEVHSGDGQSAGAGFTLVVGVPELIILTHELQEGRLNEPYSDLLQAEGGDGQAYSWTVVEGALPPGLLLDEDSGAITGTPVLAGDHVFTVRVESAGESAQQSFWIVIAPPAPEPIVMANWYLPVGHVGNQYSYPVQVTGGDGLDYDFIILEGALPPGLSLDSGTGMISGVPSQGGTFHFRVGVESGEEFNSRVLALSISTGPSSGYNIALLNASGVLPSPVMQEALNAAVARWEGVIKTNLPTYVIPAGVLQCHGYSVLRGGETVQDIVVIVDFAPMGDPGPVASGGPCAVPSGELPRVGAIRFNSDLLPTLHDSQKHGLAIHEIGHVLGIGILWSLGGRELVDDVGGPDPRFIGPAGLAAYQALGGGGSGVPVENVGAVGGGRRDVHWRQSSLGNEVMTSLIAGPGVAMPLSTFTIGSLADLGYEVDFGAADSYSISSAAPFAPHVHDPGIELHEHMSFEPAVLILPDGSVEELFPGP